MLYSTPTTRVKSSPSPYIPDTTLSLSLDASTCLRYLTPDGCISSSNSFNPAPSCSDYRLDPPLAVDAPCPCSSRTNVPIGLHPSLPNERKCLHSSFCWRLSVLARERLRICLRQ